MGKQKNSKAKRSLSSLPKGLVQRKGAKSSFADINPFELTSRQKKPKHDVHNRPVSKAKNNTKHTLESLQRRQTQLRSTLKSSKKANVFIDNRIGQYDPTMSRDDQMLARLVKERSRQSQRISKFKLDDDDDNGNGGADDKRSFLTHKGKPMDPNKMSEAIYSDDEDDDNGNLAAVDTELHFGGGGISSEQQADPYGGASSAANALDLANVYGHRKTELDDLIHRRRILKAEKMQTKEAQEDTVEKMDEAFGELSQLLQFRKNEKAPVIRPKPTEEEIGMKEWNLEMKQIMMKPKRAAATDRTKTPEEIAKEESERLHEMETRRLARMNGDFEQDDLDDISMDGNKKKSKSSKKQQQQQRKKEKRDQRNPEELSDSDDEPETPEHEAVFTADGLVYVDKDGKVVKKVGDDDDDDDDAEEEEKNENTSDENDSDISSSDQDDNEDATTIPLEVGARVKGNYRVGEQFDGQESWYDAVITKVNTEPDGTVTYDVDYDDNDFEENMIPKNVRAVEKSPEEQEKGLQKKEEEDMLKLKRKKARDKARYVMIRMLGTTNYSTVHV
jgi:nucleolar protein 14